MPLPACLAVYALYSAALLVLGLLALSRGRGGQPVPGLLSGRRLGGLRLAAFLAAAYLSGGLLSGAVAAGTRHGLDGLSLVLLQLPALFLVPGVLGRPLAALSRRLGAATPLQVLRSRYPHPLFRWAWGCALAATLVPVAAGELASGGLLLREALGIPGGAALLLLALPLLIPLLAGGGEFARRAIPLQMAVVLAGGVLLVLAAGAAGGGIEALTGRLHALSPERVRTLSVGAAAGLLRSVGVPGTATAAGRTFPAESTSLLVLLWVLAGVGALGRVQVAAVPPLAASPRALRVATLGGFLLGGAVLLLNGLAGAWSAALPAPPALRPAAGFLLLPAGGGLPAAGAALSLLAPLAAVQATAGFLLLLLAFTARELFPAAPARPLPLRLALLAFALLAAAWIALVGPGAAPEWGRRSAAVLPAVFLPPLVLGLFWRRSRTAGALAGMAGGALLGVWAVGASAPAPSLPGVPALLPLAGATALHLLVCALLPGPRRRVGEG